MTLEKRYVIEKIRIDNALTPVEIESKLLFWISMFSVIKVTANKDAKVIKIEFLFLS